MAVEAVVTGSTGVTVLPGEAWLADAGTGAQVWPARVPLRTSCTALTVWKKRERERKIRRM